MKTMMTDICERFGGRQAGSKQETDAQHYWKTIAEKFCDKVMVQPFRIAPLAKFESLKLTFGIYYVCLVLFFFDVHAAFVLSLINFILYMGHFVMYYHWLDFLFPKATSHNVVGTIEPKGEVKRTIIFSGHMDTSREFFWWYQFKDIGIYFTIIAGFMPLLYTIYCLACILAGESSPIGLGWWFFAVTSPFTLSMFFVHNRDFVPGAQDNLSGVTIATELGRYFADPANRLQHTRIKVASFGSEEIGLQGAHAYSKTYKAELEAENAININLDGVKDPKELHILSKEIMLLVNYPQWLIDDVQDSFNAVNISYQTKPLGIGASDAAAMQRNGVPSLAIIGMSMKKLDPTYHTRLDIPEHVDVRALEDVKKVLVHYTKKTDAKLVAS